MPTPPSPKAYVIRPYTAKDLPAIASMVALGVNMSKRRVKSVLDDGETLVYVDAHSGTLKGCAVLTCPPEQEKAPAGVYLYVHPEYRRGGIGQRLWQALMEGAAARGITQFRTFYRSDYGDADSFFHHRGFEKWFALHELRYDGPAFPPPDITVVPYSDEFFNNYLAIINECFYALRLENDIKPYRIYPDSAFSDEAVRRTLRENAHNIFVALEGEEPIGLGVLEDAVEGDGNGVDVVAVRPEFRGRGYGRQITQFCINMLKDRGAAAVYVAVLDTNEAARHLYTTLGCTLDAQYVRARR